MPQKTKPSQGLVLVRHYRTITVWYWARLNSNNSATAATRASTRTRARHGCRTWTWSRARQTRRRVDRHGHAAIQTNHDQPLLAVNMHGRTMELAHRRDMEMHLVSGFRCFIDCLKLVVGRLETTLRTRSQPDVVDHSVAPLLLDRVDTEEVLAGTGQAQSFVGIDLAVASDLASKKSIGFDKNIEIQTTESLSSRRRYFLYGGRAYDRSRIILAVVVIIIHIGVVFVVLAEMIAFVIPVISIMGVFVIVLGTAVFLLIVIVIIFVAIPLRRFLTPAIAGRTRVGTVIGAIVRAPVSPSRRGSRTGRCRRRGAGVRRALRNRTRRNAGIRCESEYLRSSINTCTRKAGGRLAAAGRNNEEKRHHWHTQSLHEYPPPLKESPTQILSYLTFLINY